MGIKLKDLASIKEIKIEDLHGKVLAVDAHNILYQFLTTIRQRDGSLLMDSKGRVTSHLNGLFYRTTRLMQQGLKMVFIFDGTPPEIKSKELEKRKARKIEAKVVEQEPLTVSLAYVLGFDDQFAQPWPGGNIDLVGLVALLIVCR